MPGEVLKKIRIILADAAASFRKNNDLSAASSLAFSTTLALIPALFLLTFLLGAAIGSSTRALRETEELLAQLIPAYSQVILREMVFSQAAKGLSARKSLRTLLEHYAAWGERADSARHNFPESRAGLFLKNFLMLPSASCFSPGFSLWRLPGSC
jgi:hypothetical protein